MYTQVAREQSCANHMQHIERLSCATHLVPLGTKGQFSCYAWQNLYRIYFCFVLLAEPLTDEGFIKSFCIRYNWSYGKTHACPSTWPSGQPVNCPCMAKASRYVFGIMQNFVTRLSCFLWLLWLQFDYSVTCQHNYYLILQCRSKLLPWRNRSEKDRKR